MKLFDNKLECKPTKRPRWKLLVSRLFSYLVRALMVFCLLLGPVLAADQQNITAWIALILGTISSVWIIYAIYTDEDRNLS
jgi:hypothetical protein